MTGSVAASGDSFRDSAVDGKRNALGDPALPAFDAVYEERGPRPSARSLASPEWIPSGFGFDQPIERLSPSSRAYDADEWTELLRSSSDHRLLPPELGERLLADVAAAINAHGGTYVHRSVLRLRTAQRL